MNADVSLASNIYLRRDSPVSLVHFVTNRCNARCSFCFIDFDDPETFRNELTLDEIETLARNLGPHLRNVNLTGGEPFARKELLDIARSYLRNTGVRSVFVTSNGSLPDRVAVFVRTLGDEFPDRKVILSFSIDAFPERHDEIRMIEGLFESAMRSYHLVRDGGAGAMANAAITVSHENHGVVLDLYESLIKDYGVRAITAVIVRDEGIYRIPAEHKAAILESYSTLTKRIVRDRKSGRLQGYDSSALQGRLMNKKNDIMYEQIRRIYLEPRYLSPCHAAGLFGVIAANGMVYPCEILDKPLGHLRDYDFDLMKLWQDKTTGKMRQWIKDSRCHCTYECAWSFNILGNLRYAPRLAAGALGR